MPPSLPGTFHPMDGSWPTSLSGNFRQTRTYVPRLLDYAREHSMNIRGPLLELLWIDVHTTKHVEEQVTELQLKVD